MSKKETISILEDNSGKNILKKQDFSLSNVPVVGGQGHLKKLF